MAVSKVVKSNGDVIMDISQDNVNPNNLLQGGTAHGSDGEAVQGAVIVAPTDVTETPDTTPYLYKASEHDAVYDELVGGSVAWNQLVQNGNFESTSGWTSDGGTLSATNNILNISTTASWQGAHDTHMATTNHIYLYSCDVKKTTASDEINLYAGSMFLPGTILSTPNNTVWNTIQCVLKYTGTSASTTRPYLDNATATVSYDLRNCMFIDLTQMFGPTIADYVYNLEQSTAGSGVEWLKSYGLFTKNYYPYNAGGMISVNTSGKKVVGKNLLEITTESTTINGVTFTVDKAAGTVTANGTASATIWSFNLIQNKIYPYDVIISGCPQGGNWTDTYSIQTDSVDGRTYYDLGDGVTFPKGKSLILRIVIRSGYTANNLVFKPMIRRADVTDSTFEPYTSITYPIQSTDLRGLYKLNGNKLYTDGDIYSADGTVTRKYGIVDLGTLEWTYNYSQFLTNVNGIKNSGAAMLICSKYPMTTANMWTNMTDKTCGSIAVSDQFRVNDSSYTDAATFKTAMSGVYLIYELATPTTETASSYTSPQMVYRNGTEEYLDTRDVPMPVGGNRKYVDIPEWMVNEYFDDVRAEASTLKSISKLQQENEVLRNALSETTYIIPEGVTEIVETTITARKRPYVYIPRSVISIGTNGFYDCPYLLQVTLPNSVTSIGQQAFRNCPNLGIITIPDSVTSIGIKAFSECYSLEGISIPSSVTSIGNNAFQYCDNLSIISINKPQDSISGAPWGAPSATVYWNT